MCYPVIFREIDIDIGRLIERTSVIALVLGSATVMLKTSS